jgi:hypothetical protein
MAQVLVYGELTTLLVLDPFVAFLSISKYLIEELDLGMLPMGQSLLRCPFSQQV